MKISLRIFRLSRKLVMIVSGVLLLSGVAGATAVYIGKDKILGSDKPAGDHLECTSVQEMKIHKKGHYWYRKYIKADAGDGMARVKTAMRVAAAVYEKEKPDLVQVVVLDRNGPTLRADMRGRAIGADVIYVPHPEAMPELADTPVLQARYSDGVSNATGEFYGQKMVMPDDEAGRMIASLGEHEDCALSEVEEIKADIASQKEGEAAAEGGEAKPAGEHGAAPAEGGEESAAPAGEGEREPVAEAKPAGEHGAAPAESAEAATKTESKGWFDSAKSMVFGSDDTASSGAEKPAGAAHGAAPAESAAPAEEGEVQPAAEHGAAPAAVKEEAVRPAPEGEAEPAHEAKPGETAAPAEAAAKTADKPAEGEGWFGSVKSMVFGSDETAATGEAKPSAPAPEAPVKEAAPASHG